MPFSLTNALATFQALINYIIRLFLDVLAVYYLNNILIYSRTLEEYRRHIREVLDVLYTYKLLVNRDKSEFYI